MKYAVIAALLASANAASKLTGCKAGIKGNIYTDGKCEKEVTSSFNLMSHHVKFTGKCVEENASATQKENLKTAELNVVAAAKETKKELARVNALDKVEVDDPSVEGNKKVTEKSVAKAFNQDYPELKKKFNAWKEAEAAMTEYVKTFLVADEHNNVVAYYRKYYLWYKQKINPDDDEATQDSLLATAKSNLDAAKDAAPENTKFEILEKAATTEALFKK